MSQEKTLKPSALKAWILAARPQIFTASILPIAAGSALAFLLHQRFEWYIFLCGLLSALSIQIGSHFANDALDYLRGTDTKKRIGFKRAVQQGWISVKSMFIASYITFGLAILFSIPVAITYPIILPIVILCAILGYLYTGGPYPLAYVGLGDLFVILFYGFAITGTIYYAQSGTLDAPALLLGLQIGLLAATCIAINNFRDATEDAKTGKRTLAVLFGPTFSRVEITVTLLLPFVLNICWLLLGYPTIAMLPLIAVPTAINVIQYIWKTEPSEVYNTVFIQASLVHTLFCGLFILACFL